MPDPTSITGRVLDTLASSGLITIDQLGVVNDAAASGRGAGDVLIERGLVTPADIATLLEDEMGVPRVDLSSYAPDDEALALVPANVARSRRVLPLFEIEGALTVAIGDPMDVFALDVLGRELGVEIDPVLADPTDLLGAIAQNYDGREEAAAPAAVTEAPAPAPVDVVPPAPPVAPMAEEEEPPPPPPSVDMLDDLEAPAAGDALPAEDLEPQAHTVEEVAAADVSSGDGRIDLDVLAVADARKTAVLVADIIEDAAARGASRIHLLPYKDDFFLVYRIAGRLEKVATAPLSMQAALVDAFKTFAKLGSVPASVPAMGRVHARLGDTDAVLTVSAVPTVAGQRVVITIVPQRSAPALAGLGMTEAEARAMRAMVERGRGILLLCAPVSAGRSTTYYALLNEAANAGKTVYSVERSVDYEIPAVAQVMVNPGSSVGAAAHIAAGLRQDTDVIAVDGLQAAEEVHLAVEAASLGKLVIATFAAGDIVSGVRRMLDLGAEPVSLAAALTLGVGQRLVRTNCPNCSIEQRSPLAGRLPGVPADFVEHAGTGCPNCAKTGFRGMTGVFEVLPFTEPVRSVVAHDPSAADLAAAAKAAGMRPLAVSGMAKAREGAVSLAELDRVLRLS